MTKKIPCSRVQLLKLAAKHSVDRCHLPLSIDQLKQLGGVWVVSDYYAADIRRYFCRTIAKDSNLHLEMWNWPKQIHHSTLVIHEDDTYEIIHLTKEGRGHTPAWNYFMKCARVRYFFIMPKEIEI